MARIITVASGKGGVGKTNISVNMAVQLARNGHRTCLFDADLGLANVNILLGIYPEDTLEDVLTKKKSLKDVIIRDYEGIDIIPGSSGVQMMADLDPRQVEPLIAAFSELDGYDFFFFDTSAGISKNVIAFCKASTEMLLVITPESTSLADAYGLLKVLALNGFRNPVRVVVNGCKDGKTANVAYVKLKRTVQKYLPIQIAPLGMVFNDRYVGEAVKEQKPFVVLYPNSSASKCIQHLAKQLVDKGGADEADDRDFESFWTSFFSFSKEELTLGPRTGASPEAPAGTAGSQKATPEKKPARPAPEAVRTAGHVSVAADGALVGMVQENHRLLARLLDSFSALSQEVAAIRKAVENGHQPHLQAPASTRHAETRAEPMSALVAEARPSPVVSTAGQGGRTGQGPKDSWIFSKQEDGQIDTSRRKSARIELICPVKIDGFPGTARVTDMSSGGVFIECDKARAEKFGAGQHVRLFMKLPTEDEPIEVDAEVANVRGLGMGCRFKSLSRKNAEAIRHCLDVFKDTLPIL